jgi:hypothetical protein
MNPSSTPIQGDNGSEAATAPEKKTFEMSQERRSQEKEAVGIATRRILRPLLDGRRATPFGAGGAPRL